MYREIIRSGRGRAPWAVEASSVSVFPTPTRSHRHRRPLPSGVGMLCVTPASLIAGMTIPEEDADVGQGSKYCLVAIGRLQVRNPSQVL